MATSFDSVIDMALIIMRDYKLDSLYEESEDDFKQVMDGYMIKAVPKFKVSTHKDLTYDLENREFLEDLDMLEIDILSDWTVIDWYTDQMQDVLEFRETLSNIDFKRLATGQNLKPRQAWLEELRRKVKQDATNYLFQDFSKLPYFNGNN